MYQLSIGLARESKAVAADDHAVLQDHAVANPAVLPNAGMGVREKVVADFCAAIDGDKAVQHGISSDFDFFIDKAIGPNVRPGADVRRFGDNRGGVNTGCELWRWMKKFDCSREIKIGIRRPQRGHGHWASIACDEDGRSPALIEQRTVFSVHKESELAGFCFLDAGNAGDLEVRIALEFAAELCGNFSQFHDRVSLILSHTTFRNC